MSTRNHARIGICAPYGWDESTHMALSLGETVGQFGFHASYLPFGTRLTDPAADSVHHRWDHEILKVNGAPFDAWVKDVATVVWFNVHPAKLDIARRAGKRNILVALPHVLATADVPHFTKYDRIVCPSQAAYDLVRRQSRTSKALLMPWDSSIPLGARMNAPIKKNERRLLVHVDENALEAFGDNVLRVIGDYLTGSTAAKVTLAISGDMTKGVERRVASYTKQFPDRFVFMPRMCAMERGEAAIAHDWVWVVTQQSNAGAWELEYLTHGRPVITFDSPASNEVIAHLQNGYIIPCQRGVTRLGAEVVTGALYDTMRETVLYAVFNWANFNTIYKSEWTDLEKRRRGFHEGWKMLLDAGTLHDDET